MRAKQKSKNHIARKDSIRRLVEASRPVADTSEPLHALHALDERQAARYLGVSAGLLKLWREADRRKRTRTGPVYFKPGPGSKVIRYLRSSLDAWVACNSQPIETSR